MPQSYCPRCQTNVLLQPNGTDCANCNTPIVRPLHPSETAAILATRNTPSNPKPPAKRPRAPSGKAAA